MNVVCGRLTALIREPIAAVTVNVKVDVPPASKITLSMYAICDEKLWSLLDSNLERCVRTSRNMPAILSAVAIDTSTGLPGSCEVSSSMIGPQPF
jgi:hypothetical protein